MIRHSIRIAASVDAVFRGVGLPHELGQWDPSVTAIDFPPGLAPGDFGQIHWVGLPALRFQLLKWGAHTGISLVCETALGQIKRQLFFRERQNVTQVTYTTHVEGVIAGVPANQWERRFEQYLGAALENVHLRGHVCRSAQATSA